MIKKIFRIFLLIVFISCFVALNLLKGYKFGFLNILLIILMSLSAVVFLLSFVNLLRLYLPFKATIWYFGKWFVLSLFALLSCLLALKLLKGYKVGFLNGLLIVLITISAIVFLLSFVNFVKPFVYINNYFSHVADIKKNGRVMVVDGSPGAGKSYSMTSDGVLLARTSWFILCFDYFLGLSQLKKPTFKFESLDAEKRFRLIEECYLYYQAHPELIPLLFSNYPIKIGKQMSAVLKFEHFIQEERLPEGAVIMFDEAADCLSNQRSVFKDADLVNKNNLINELISKERHFGDWYMLFAEQDSGELFIGVRRVAGINRYLSSCKSVCEPRFLNWRLDRIGLKILRKSDKASISLSDKYIRLFKKSRRIGFLKIEFIDYGNSEKRTELKNQGYYCLPLDTDFEYETRAYLPQYSALDKLLNITGHDGMYMPAIPEKLAPLVADKLADEIRHEESYRKLMETAGKNRKWEKERPDECAAYRELYKKDIK